MSWINFSKIKASLFFVSIFGAFTFFLGTAFNKLPNKLPNNLSERDKQIISFIGSPAIALAFLALINSRISEEIESDVNTKKIELEYEVNLKKRDLEADFERKLEEGIIKENENFMKFFKEYIEKLKKEIASLKSEEARDIMQRHFTTIESIQTDYNHKRKAERKIAEWICVPENRLALLKASLDAVSQANYDIPKTYKLKFDKDIEECINWLYGSILLRQACQVEPKHTSALADIPKKYKPYEVALTAIQHYLENEKELENYYTKAQITVEKMVSYLIERLQRM